MTTENQQTVSPEPRKQMSIENYIKGLEKEHKVAKLRAEIASYLYQERAATYQLSVLQQEALKAISRAEQEKQEVQNEDKPVDSSIAEGTV